MIKKLKLKLLTKSFVISIAAFFAVVAIASAVTTISANIETGGTLTVSGGTVSSSALATIGTAVTATGVDVSANVGSVAGLQVNLKNTAATVTGFRGIDSRVENAGAAGTSMVGLQAVVKQTSGANTGESWGTNSILQINGGSTENAYAVVGDLTVAAGAAIGTDGRPDNYITAGLFSRDVESTADLANASVDAAVIALLVGNNTNGATKLKADAGVAVIVGGDSATVTGGAAFKVFRHNSTAASKLDYGVDLYSSEGGGYLDNSFATADIR